MSQVDLQLSGDKVTKAAYVRLLIWRGKNDNIKVNDCKGNLLDIYCTSTTTVPGLHCSIQM